MNDGFVMDFSTYVIILSALAKAKTTQNISFMIQRREDNILARDYQGVDYEQIMDLWNRTGLGGRGRGDDRDIIEASIEMGGKLVVLEDGRERRIVGTSWMTFDGRRIHLHHIGVLPEYRNKGYGKWLTRLSLEYAKKKGYQIKLEVREDNEKAIGMYRELGFQRLGDYDIYIVRDVSSLDV